MLQAGFARVEVTPPLGTALTGYFEDRISDGILDPIQLNALAVSLDDEAILVITGDFMYMDEVALTGYRKAIAAELPVEEDHILLQSVHQHTSTTAGPSGPTSQEYQYILTRKYCDAARMALDDLCEAKVSIAEQETAEPISFIRRFRMKDGSTQTNPGFFNPEILEPIGEADNTVRLVKFERKDGGDIALVNFATHPDVIGGNRFSADWPGFVRRMTEAEIPGTHCILLNGCQGDTNHFDVFHGNPYKGYEQSRYMGRVITDTVLQIWNRTEPVAVDTISAQVVMKRTPTNRNGIERIEECRELAELMKQGLLPDTYNMGDRGEIRRIAEMEDAMLVQKIPVTVIGLGPIAILGYGGEPFTEYARIPRAEVPELFLLTACLANGSEGYLPSASAFAEGGYEARTANFTPEMVPLLQNTAVDMLKTYVTGRNNEENRKK